MVLDSFKAIWSISKHLGIIRIYWLTCVLFPETAFHYKIFALIQYDYQNILNEQLC